MTPFAFATAARIEFGPGVARMAAPLARDWGARALVVCGATPARVAWLAQALATAGMAVETLPTPREPTVEDARAGVALARALGADVVIGIGGGAALDLAKAVAGLMREPGDPLDHLELVGRGEPLTRDPPALIAIPTTAGTGSEVTRNAVLGAPEHGRKVSLRDARLLPRAALVDPDLLAGLPKAVALASGLDAIVQVIEPFISRFANSLTDALCRDAIPRGLTALPRLLANDSDSAARAEMALTSLCGGLALANARLGAVHGLAGVIGGRIGAAHGAVVGRLAGPVLAATEAALPTDHPTVARFAQVRGWIAQALGGAEDAAFERLAAFADAHGLPRLAAMGVAQDDFAAIAQAALAGSSTQGAPVAPTAALLAQALRAA